MLHIHYSAEESEQTERLSDGGTVTRRRRAHTCEIGWTNWCTWPHTSHSPVAFAFRSLFPRWGLLLLLRQSLEEVSVLP